MKPLPDPWPLPKNALEVLTKELEELASRGDLREKLADLSFVRKLNHRDRKLRKAPSAIASFKTASELKLWWQDIGNKLCNCSRKDKALYGHEIDCLAVDEFLKRATDEFRQLRYQLLLTGINTQNLPHFLTSRQTN